MRVETSTHLPVSPEDAWRTLLRWEEQSKWIRDADSVRVLTEHREGLGVRIAVRNRVFNIPMFTEDLEVTGWDPPRRLQMTHMSFIHGAGTWKPRNGSGSRTVAELHDRLDQIQGSLSSLQLVVEQQTKGARWLTEAT